MTIEDYQKLLPTLPNLPGVYKFIDADNKLIYVGKAKNLRKRVSSYFNRSSNTAKTEVMVSVATRLEFTIVNTEQDALLLENNLIKTFQPRYNVNLKDDKSYPYICIKNERFPRVFLTRRLIKDGSEYFGPYTSVKKVESILDYIRSLFPLRNCSLNLSKRNIEKKKFRVCLEYHLGNCKGPCEGLQTAEDYKEGLIQIKNLLKGNLSPVLTSFRETMKALAENMEFEKAEIYRKKIEHLQEYQAKSSIINSTLGNVDVFSILQEGDIAYINYLMVQNGMIVQTHTMTFEKKLEETAEEIMEFGITTIRETFNSDAPEIVLPFPVYFPHSHITVTVPKAGDKKKLLELSEKNVNYFKEELRKRKLLQLDGKSAAEKEKVLDQLQYDLNLSERPLHIECFDNSNFQGSFPVSAMVCFKMGVPSKSDYRHFNVKSVDGINDFATMKEAVLRRYKRLSVEKKPMPQLVVIDGGKGQLGAANEAINELGLAGKMTLVGLAKNEEEIFFSGDKQSIKLPWDSDSLKLLRQIRDEVHRFGITFHRQKRSKGTFKNELESIPGIGKTTTDILLKELKSVKRIRSTSEDIITKLVGQSKAKILMAYFERNPVK